MSLTEEEYTVAEESGNVTVCLVMNIDVITTTQTTFGVTLSTSDGPLAIGMCSPVFLTIPCDDISSAFVTLIKG